MYSCEAGPDLGVCKQLNGAGPPQDMDLKKIQPSSTTKHLPTIDDNVDVDDNVDAIPIDDIHVDNVDAIPVKQNIVL